MRPIERSTRTKRHSSERSGRLRWNCELNMFFNIHFDQKPITTSSSRLYFSLAISLSFLFLWLKRGKSGKKMEKKQRSSISYFFFDKTPTYRAWSRTLLRATPDITVPEIVWLSAVGSVAIGRPSSPSAIVSRMRADSRTVIANRRVALMRHDRVTHTATRVCH